ncbi:hypothetical protein F751_5472 [Auxenochlorella protothecoides]|uniref:Uncharacterized protein n=1 Tax=Auxenochlorella protothecoides TaxID=3075 RepID=A0A087STR2_AUXPR|nr:hypothetical protein F751_5472 [Auxenochlorella protothecoides]KFM29116.1 hypothetical protein F751_5472 [Auxenochlorella protothecoides]RMZ53467.1 hypothetical protein APUTEX25_003289 [Auxenochlorella protothecoides]|eukprot:RMZ53467.1 hypothetical protein APUTEX25_003289 [Auxenochlorella protothecoides]
MTATAHDNPRGDLLVQSIKQLQASEAGAAFDDVSVDDVILLLDASHATATIDPLLVLGLNSEPFCRLMALRRGYHVLQPQEPAIGFEEPRLQVAAKGVILTTYFTSRVDPARCHKHVGGAIPPDDLAYVQGWHSSVQHLGTPAVVFHDGLSPAFISELQSPAIGFQRVTLSYTSWSLSDERWAVYRDWLAGPGISVSWVLALDLADGLVAKAPWEWFAQQRKQHDLWVGVVQEGSDAVPKQDAFLDLAATMVMELEYLHGAPQSAAWNCGAAALAFTVAHPRFKARHTVFDQGLPFSAQAAHCWKQGDCQAYVYHQ